MSLMYKAVFFPENTIRRVHLINKHYWMGGCGRGCHFLVRSALAEHWESLRHSVYACKCYCPHYMTNGTGLFKDGTVPCLQPQGGFLREQEEFCTLQKQPSENTGIWMPTAANIRM